MSVAFNGIHSAVVEAHATSRKVVGSRSDDVNKWLSIYLILPAGK
jgi:hypothetical protein